MIWTFFPALTRPKFCAWCSIQATFPTLPNVGTFITDGQLDVWRSFSCRVIVKRSWVWNIRRCVTDIILWFRSHKSVCLLITCVNIQCLASFLLLTEKAGEAFTVSSAWWASKQDCPSPMPQQCWDVSKEISFLLKDLEFSRSKVKPNVFKNRLFYPIW